MDESLAPIIPLYVLGPVALASMFAVLYQLREMRDLVTRFVILAVWLRYAMSAFHPYTFPPVVAGLSINAVASMGVMGLGFALLGSAPFKARRFVPIYILIALCLVSSLVNGQPMKAVNPVIKWLYLVSLTAAFFEAFRRHGLGKISSKLAWAFLLPITLQALSVVLRITKATEADGSVSFIGGYNHEAAFSVILLTFLIISALSPSISFGRAMGQLLAGMIGIVLANYRTALLAAVLPFAAALAARTASVFDRRQRIAIMVVGCFVIAGGALAAGSLAQERFKDIGRVLTSVDDLIQLPERYTADERKIFSARVYIWSNYVNSYLEGDFVTYVLGYGPDAWVGRFRLYAHNTFVSFLYELGLTGTLALIWLLAANMFLAMTLSSDIRLAMVASYLGFIVLNMATMPLWQIEGNILLAFLLSSTWYAAWRGPSFAK